jgi:hypothetical protein
VLQWVLQGAWNQEYLSGWAEPLEVWRDPLVRVVCIQWLMMGREQGLFRDIKYAIRILERWATKPFCGVELAMRGAGLVGLEKERERWGIGKSRNETGYAP